MNQKGISIGFPSNILTKSMNKYNYTLTKRKKLYMVVIGKKE